MVEIEGATLGAVRLVKEARLASDPPIVGWVTLKTPWAGGWDVLILVERPEGGVQVLYEGRFPSDAERGTFRRPDDPRPLVGEEIETWMARQTALDAYRGDHCAWHLEVVVVPPTEQTPEFTVYPLPYGRPEDLVVGGHHRFRVTRDGARLIEDESLSEACRTIALTGTRLEQGAIPVSNRSVDVPHESLVVLNVASGWPLRVTTRRGLWEIFEGRLFLLERHPP
jgi:hypothetical protein